MIEMTINNHSPIYIWKSHLNVSHFPWSQISNMFSIWATENCSNLVIAQWSMQIATHTQREREKKKSNNQTSEFQFLSLSLCAYQIHIFHHSTKSHSTDSIIRTIFSKWFPSILLSMVLKNVECWNMIQIIIFHHNNHQATI